MSLITVETVVDENAEEYVFVEDAAKQQQLVVHEEPIVDEPIQFRDEPMEWDELVDIITVQNALEKLVRSEKQQEEYEAFLSKLLEEWNSVSDHILCDKFPKIFTKEHDETTQRFTAQPPLQDVVSTGNSYVKVVRNDFPYHMAKGIEHWIVWKVGDENLSTEEIDHARSLEVLGSRLEDDMLHWVNPPHLKSLPELDHIHILGKRMKVDANASMNKASEDDSEVPLLNQAEDDSEVPLLKAADDDAELPSGEDADLVTLEATNESTAVPLRKQAEDDGDA